MTRPENLEAEHRRLQELTHRNLLQLMNSELKLNLTMTSLAQTEAEIGDVSHARVLLEKVADAIGTVRQHMTDPQISRDEP